MIAFHFKRYGPLHHVSSTTNKLKLAKAFHRNLRTKHFMHSRNLALLFFSLLLKKAQMQWNLTSHDCLFSFPSQQLERTLYSNTLPKESILFQMWLRPFFIYLFLQDVDLFPDVVSNVLVIATQFVPHSPQLKHHIPILDNLKLILSNTSAHEFKNLLCVQCVVLRDASFSLLASQNHCNDLDHKQCQSLCTFIPIMVIYIWPPLFVARRDTLQCPVLVTIFEIPTMIHWLPYLYLPSHTLHIYMYIVRTLEEHINFLKRRFMPHFQPGNSCNLLDHAIRRTNFQNRKSYLTNSNIPPNYSPYTSIWINQTVS